MHISIGQIDWTKKPFEYIVPPTRGIGTKIEGRNMLSSQFRTRLLDSSKTEDANKVDPNFIIPIIYRKPYFLLYIGQERSFHKYRSRLGQSLGLRFFWDRYAEKVVKIACSENFLTSNSSSCLFILKLHGNFFCRNSFYFKINPTLYP